MSTRSAVITALYGRVTGDPAIQAACGGPVRMAYHMAQPDTAFPYLVHRIDGEVADPWDFETGVWFLDLWDHATNRDRLLTIRELVIIRMDRLLLPVAIGAATAYLGVRLIRDREGPTDAPDVFRVMTEWSLLVERSSEVAGILSR